MSLFSPLAEALKIPDRDYVAWQEWKERAKAEIAHPEPPAELVQYLDT